MLSTPTDRQRATIGAVLTALLACLLMVGVSPSASAASETGKVRGNILAGSQGQSLKLKLLTFDANWRFLGARNVFGGAYSISLPAGIYHLQFVDQRPAYDVTKFAPSDVKVRVTKGSTTLKNVQMRKGAAITGTVKANGKPAKKARVVAANANEQSFEVMSNDKGQFALGGLPAGSYSLFTYDKARAWVGKSLYLKNLGSGKFANVTINLTQRAGGLLVDLYAGGKPLLGRPFITAVSKASGQFWTARAKGGSVTFRGLFPGGYRLVAPAVGRYFGRTANVKGGMVKPGRVAFGSFKLTKRGGAFTGIVVRGETGNPMQGATVRLYNRAGDLLGEMETGNDGKFLLGGQLTTQGGMKVIAFSKYDPAYEKLTRSSLTIKVGQDKSLGTLALQRDVMARAS